VNRRKFFGDLIGLTATPTVAKTVHVTQASDIQHRLFPMAQVYVRLDPLAVEDALCRAIEGVDYSNA